ncbi:MAG: lipocalin family protein [Bdellovibrio sp.]|nr:lipocalin family protein [Bdellovibrio sp.]
MKKLLFTILLSGALTVMAASKKDPSVVKSVDFNRYAGLWYDIAHNPNFFQKDCLRSTAEYGVLSATEVSVHNICYLKDGTTADISGVATVKNSNEPAKLKVKFNFFARGDYWIIDLDPNYQWVVVSAPKKKSLFILSRVAPMDKQLLEDILKSLKAKGFKTEQLVFDQY